MKAAFFFGSGISFESGVPNVATITNSAFKDDWHYHTSGIFLHGPNNNKYIEDEKTPAVRAYLVHLREIAKEYLEIFFNDEREPSYEDIYSLAEQVSHVGTDFMPNLAVVEFYKLIRKRVRGFAQLRDYNKTEQIINISHDACGYLHDVVRYNIGKSYEVKGLDILSDVVQSLDNLDIFSLNHDLLIEKELQKHNIIYEDGFSETDSHAQPNRRGDVIPFTGWSRQSKVNLIKLHGSLKWYLYEFPNWDGNGLRVRQYCRILSDDSAHCKDQYGNLLSLVEHRPTFLSGTIVKEQHYGLALWSDIFNFFNRSINNYSNVIFCGYGFKDTGINYRINQWAHNLDPKGRRLIILTEDVPDTYLSDKPVFLKKLYKAGQITFVDKYLKDCELKDLCPFFQ